MFGQEPIADDGDGRTGNSLTGPRNMDNHQQSAEQLHIFGTLSPDTKLAVDLLHSPSREADRLIERVKNVYNKTVSILESQFVTNFQSRIGDIAEMNCIKAGNLLTATKFDWEKKLRYGSPAC